MATFWFETCVEGYFWLKLPVGRQFKSLEEYSPLDQGALQEAQRVEGAVWEGEGCEGDRGGSV
jgi:hypothetical protein